MTGPGGWTQTETRIGLRPMEPNQILMNATCYSIEDLAVVIHRHAHDVRNALNGMELELAVLDENSPDPALKSAVKRLRGAAAEIGRHLQALSSKYGVESPCVLPAFQIAERWQADAWHLGTCPPIEWELRFDDEMVRVESGLTRWLLNDALDLAIKCSGRRPLRIRCRGETGCATFSVEPVEPTRVPLLSEATRAYWDVVCRLAERNGGRMEPSPLAPDQCFPMRLVLPIHQTDMWRDRFQAVAL